MARLENWAAVKPPEIDLKNSLTLETALSYLPPEVLNQGFQLKGQVYDHPMKENGTQVRTSMVRDFDWNVGVAYTRSGTTYVLGAPHPEWVAWLKTSPTGQEILEKVLKLREALGN